MIPNRGANAKKGVPWGILYFVMFEFRQNIHFNLISVPQTQKRLGNTEILRNHFENNNIPNVFANILPDVR